MNRPNPVKQPPEPIRCPFSTCGNCPYVAHGFQCYRTKEDCFKTRIEHITNRNIKKTQQ